MKKTAGLCLLTLIFGMVVHSCIAASDQGRINDADFITRHGVRRWLLQEDVIGELAERLRVLEAGQAANHPAPVEVVSSPVSGGLVIPEIAKGYEEIYQRFLRGKLIYKPHPNSDQGKIELLIATLENPLEGTFNLSQCGDTGKYLSIATGYRKRKNSENANKLEIWLTPWFLANKVLNDTAANHYLRAITTGKRWDADKAPVGLFWTYGEWDDLSLCDYLTTKSMDDLSSGDLYKKWHQGTAPNFTSWHAATDDFNQRFPLPHLSYDFHISFVN